MTQKRQIQKIKKTKYTIFTLARQNVRKVLFAELDSLSKWVRDRR